MLCCIKDSYDVGRILKDMWLSKPIYESLPYTYILVGAVSLVATIYVDWWYWPTIATVIGITSLIAGLVVWLRRRDYRQNRDRKIEISDETPE